MSVANTDGAETIRKADLKALRKFFEVLYGTAGPDDGVAAILRLNPCRPEFFAHDDIEGLANATAKRSVGADVYNAVNLLRPEAIDAIRAHGGRGTEDDLRSVVALVADVDAGKEPYPSQEFVLRVIREMPLSPTMIVRSGHADGGVHCYWLLHEPENVVKSEDRDRVKDISKRWQALLRSKMQGKKLDTTHDLVRILRPSGSINHKYNAVVTPLEMNTDRRYELADFEPFLPPEPEKSKPTPSKKVDRDALSKIPRSRIIDQARGYVSKIPGGASTENNKSRTYQVACRLVQDFGLSINEAWPLLAEWNETRIPPRTEAELQHKLDDADKYEGERGWLVRTNGQAHVPSGAERKTARAGSKLDPATEAARYLAKTEYDNVSRLRCWRGSFFYWKCGAYREMEISQVRSKLIRHLNHDTYKLTGTVVANILDQLRAQSELSWDIDAPAWLTTPEPWPASELLVARNGIFHLPSIVAGQPSQLPATPKLFSTMALDYDVSLTPDKPEAFLRFLNELWPDDNQSIVALQEWCGYLLTPDTSQQKMLFLVGPKRSGKGTLARVIRAMVGVQNVVGPTLASFSQNFGLHPLIGKSLAVVSDARLSGRTDKAVVMERLLSISGEDSLTIDRKYGTAITVKLPTRIMLLSNELPRFSDTSGAIASRMIFLQLTQSFYGKEDPKLTDRLLMELPAILMWSIGGWKSLRERGHFLQPESTKALADEMENLALVPRLG